MANEELIKELLKGKTLENLGKAWNNRDSDAGDADADDSIDGVDSDEIEEVGREKIESLKEAISEIEQLIQSRAKLSREVLTEAEAIKIDVNNFISNTSSGRRIEDPAFIRDQLALKQKQVDVSELQLKEKIDCWKDITLLKKELREKRKELKEREARIEMLSKILTER